MLYLPQILAQFIIIPFGCNTYNVTEYLSIGFIFNYRHLQTHKLLSLAIIAKKEEVERKTKEIESWDKKYKEVNVDFKEAFDLKKNFYESTNPTYKKLMEIETAQRIAEVELKRLKSVFERRQKSKKLLEQIQEKIFHKTIVNFISAILRKKKYVEITCKTKILEEQKKKMVRNMFEAQEARELIDFAFYPKFSLVLYSGFSQKTSSTSHSNIKWNVHKKGESEQNFFGLLLNIPSIGSNS